MKVYCIKSYRVYEKIRFKKGEYYNAEYIWDSINAYYHVTTNDSEWWWSNFPVEDVFSKVNEIPYEFRSYFITMKECRLKKLKKLTEL
jgi:hypothetical protein